MEDSPQNINISTSPKYILRLLYSYLLRGSMHVHAANNNLRVADIDFHDRMMT